MCQTMHSTASYIISNGNSASSNYTYIQTGSVLHIFENKQTLYCIEFRNIYFIENKRTGHMQKDRFIVKNFFVVKYKTKYSCKSAIYFDLDADTI